MRVPLGAVGLAVAVLGGLGVPATAQNLLQNGVFDSGTAPWFSGTFSTLDALGSPSSGSLQDTNTASTPFTYVSVVSECMPVTAGAAYERRFDYRLVSSAGGTGAASVRPGWYGNTDCNGFGFLGTGGVPPDDLADGAWHPSAPFGALTAPAGAQSANLRLETSKTQAGGSVTANFDNVVFKAAGSCAPLPDVLCLNNGRFQVEADWETVSATGRARVVKLTNDTGYLWFFHPDNVEVVIKVLDACGFVGKFWVFAGGLTDQGVEIRVTDTHTGATNTYQNARGNPFQPLQDTVAFNCP